MHFLRVTQCAGRNHSEVTRGGVRFVCAQYCGGDIQRQDVLCWSSWWIEKAAFWSECGRAFTSLLRISRDGGDLKSRQHKRDPGDGCQGQIFVSTPKRVGSAASGTTLPQSC